MANGRVEIHDPMSNDHSRTEVPASDPGAESLEDTEEFRILMAYATRRRGDGAPVIPVALTAPDTPVKAEKEEPKHENEASRKKGEKKIKKKKKGWKRLPLIFRCVKPSEDAEEPPSPEDDRPPMNGISDRVFIGAHDVQEEEDDKFAGVAKELMKLADKIPLDPPDIETDSGDDVEKIIGLLLRETGDELNEKLKDANVGRLFQNYDFFRTLMDAFFSTIGFRNPNPDALGPQASPKTQLAITCEVTSRLSAANTLPTTSLFRHGAQYMQQYYSGWAQQEGGYEAAIESDEEEVE
ncbi:uncharacterized protein ACNS7B_001806 [Menidia menidia]